VIWGRRKTTENLFTRQHLLDHVIFHKDCPGCQANAKNKKHVKGSLTRDGERHKHTITMYQVVMADEDGTLGIGNFKYALVICKIYEDFVGGVLSH